MKSFKLALIIASTTFVAASYAKHIDTQTVALASVNPELQAVKFFEESKSLSEFKSKCSQAALTKFAEVADKIKASPRFALTLEAEYRALAGAIKKRFGFNIAQAMSYINS